MAFALNPENVNVTHGALEVVPEAISGQGEPADPPRFTYSGHLLNGAPAVATTMADKPGR